MFLLFLPACLLSMLFYHATAFRIGQLKSNEHPERISHCLMLSALRCCILSRQRAFLSACIILMRCHDGFLAQARLSPTCTAGSEAPLWEL